MFGLLPVGPQSTALTIKMCFINHLIYRMRGSQVLKKGLYLLLMLAIWLSPFAYQGPAAAADPVNLALNKPVTTDSQLDGYDAAGAVDSDVWGTSWTAANGDLPHWLKVDLGEPATLSGTTITWKPWNVINQYKIEVSPDDVNWTVALDQTARTSKDQVQNDSFLVSDVRYVRVTITAVGEGNWAGIYDLKVWEGQPQITNLRPVSVETEVGTTPVLPEAVTAEYGTVLKQVPVQWDTVAESSYAQTGSFEVQGTIAGTTLKAAAHVTVKGLGGTVITGFEPLTVSTYSGVAPVLPATVTALYGDGSTAELPVHWGDLAYAQYEEAGAFELQGSVAGTTLHPTAHIVVQELILPVGFIKGVDISTLPAIEAAGGKYYDNGVERDLLDILKDRGVNYIRLRLWNDPQEAAAQMNNREYTVELAKRVKEKGFKLLLDFHYSDFWADPGTQTKPEAWSEYTYEELKEAVYDYTRSVLTELKEEGALPDMVQIGNEINGGMLWPEGKSYGQDNAFDKLVPLLDSGVRGVKDSLDPGQDVKIMIHLAEGGKNGTFRWFYDELQARHLDYDVIGMSYYPYWHGTLAELQYNMNDVAARYGKEIVIAETAYPHTLENGDSHGNIIGTTSQVETGGFPATVQGQAEEVKTVMSAVAQVPGGKGKGIFYWEPAWIPAQGVGWKAGEGNAWENQAMFDFQGNALDSLDVYLTPVAPESPPQTNPHPNPNPVVTPVETASSSTPAPAQVSVSADEVAKSIAAALGGKVVVSLGSKASEQQGIIAEVPLQAIQQAGEAVKALAVEAAGVTLILPVDSKKGILTSDSRTLQVSIVPADRSKLPEELQTKLAGYPVYDFSLAVDGKEISSFKPQSVYVEMKYAPKQGEKLHQLVVYYIGDDSGLELVPNAKYDEADSVIRFSPKHFSRYGAAPSVQEFRDLGQSAWAAEAVEALASRGLVEGTVEGIYEPTRQITRAEYLQMLMNTLELPSAKAGAIASFNDVQPGDWFAPAAAAAQSLGIAEGYGDGRFGPNDSITREEMALFTDRAVKAMQRQLPAQAGAAAKPFADQERISPYAQDSVQALAAAGILEGFENGSFQPKGLTTRAEAAAVICRLLGF